MFKSRNSSAFCYVWSITSLQLPTVLWRQHWPRTLKSSSHPDNLINFTFLLEFLLVDQSLRSKKKIQNIHSVISSSSARTYIPVCNFPSLTQETQLCPGGGVNDAKPRWHHNNRHTVKQYTLFPRACLKKKFLKEKNKLSVSHLKLFLASMIRWVHSSLGLSDKKAIFLA